MQIKTKILVLVVLALTLSFQTAKAQEVDCFDYYKFQSVKVNVSREKAEYVAGEPILFQGTIENENDYPIVDGYVFARVGKQNPNFKKEGLFIIDEFIPLEKISLDSKEKKNVEFWWPVPFGASEGEYEVDFFFSAGKKFNLGGLPFTNEIVIGKSKFKVISDNKGMIYFDKSATKFNGKKYEHIGNIPVVKSDQKFEIVQPLKNDSGKKENVKIKYDLYWWDSLNEKDKISSKEETIEIPASGSFNSKYSVEGMDRSVYYLKITAETGDGQKSIINIRFGSNLEQARLNFPAITKFPLKKGDDFTAFSCFHNASPATSRDSKVEMILEDKNGKEFGRVEYIGDISGKMMAAKSQIKAQNNYDWLKIKAKITNKNGKIVDQYETIYDCQEISPEKCLAKQKTGSLSASVRNSALIIAFVFLLFGILAIIVKRKRGENASGSGTMPFIFILVFAFTFGMTGTAFATDRYDSRSDGGRLEHESSPAYYIDWGADIEYSGSLEDGNVSKGEELDLSYEIGDPFFYASGEFYDTPYGSWNEDLDSTQWINCAASALEIPDSGGKPAMCADFTVMTSVEKPVPTVTSSNPSIVSCDIGEGKCYANNVGTAEITMTFPVIPGVAYTKGYVWDSGYSDLEPYSELANFDGLTFSWTVNVSEPLPKYTLTVTKSGAGAGMISSNKGSIICGDGFLPNCPDSYQYTQGEKIRLTATALPLVLADSIFGDFSGNCDAGTIQEFSFGNLTWAICDVTMTANKSVNARFDVNSTCECSVSDPQYLTTCIGDTYQKCIPPKNCPGGKNCPVGCGNGIVEAGEQCDDGNPSNNDTCLNSCLWNTCGDGFVKAGFEQCDLGSINNGSCPKLCSDLCMNNNCGCIPDCSCAEDVCVGNFCTEPICGVNCPGTKDCSCQCNEDDKRCGLYPDSCGTPNACTGTKTDCGEWIEVVPES